MLNMTRKVCGKKSKNLLITKYIMKDIVICMYADENVESYSKMSEKINKTYAEMNNCDFIVKRKPVFKDRHPAWERIPLILSLLKKDYKYVIYVDADAYFCLNKPGSYLLEKIIDAYKKKDVLLGKDNKQLFNTGFMIIKNTKWSYSFFWELMKSEKFINKYQNRTWEQDCAIQLYNENFKNAKKRCALLDHGILQSFEDIPQTRALVVHHQEKTEEERQLLISEAYQEALENRKIYVKVSIV